MEVGDKVKWTHCARSGKTGFYFTTRTGKIIHIGSRNVAVKYRGKIINLRPTKVRGIGETSELTEMILNQEGG